MSDAHDNWGGVRAGAGRPLLGKKPSKQIGFKLPGELVDRLEELADIRFEDAGTLVVVAEDYDGEAMVFLTRGDGADRNTVIEGGRGKLENVTPGSYRLIVSAISTSAGGVEEVALAPRMQEVDVVAGGTVTATVRKE